MAAVNTALRVLRWAASDTRGPMPEGPLADAAGLATPGPEVRAEIGRLAAITAARLALAPPPMGDTDPPGLETAIMAAAIGGHRQEAAIALLRAVPPAPCTGWDLTARHGLVAPVLPRLVDDLPHVADALRDASPLTGVLDRPGPRSEAVCEDLLDRLREEPSARALLILRFARPAEDPRQSLWRGESLAWLRHVDPEFVLDVYETALILFRSEHEIRARTAWAQVLNDGSDKRAEPTAVWWRALAELEAAEPGLVRRRPRLAGRSIGTNLYRHLQGVT